MKVSTPVILFGEVEEPGSNISPTPTKRSEPVTARELRALLVLGCIVLATFRLVVFIVRGL